MSKASFLASSAWLTLSVVFGRGAIVLSGILISAYIGAEAFALFSFLHLTASSFSAVASLGMLSALPRHVARLATRPSADAGGVVLAAMALMLLGHAAAVGAVLIVPNSLLALPEGQSAGVLIAMICAVGFYSAASGTATGMEQFRRLAGSSLLMGVVLLVGVSAALLWRRVDLAIYTYIASVGLAGLILLKPFSSFLREVFSVSRPKTGKATLQRLFGQSIQLVIVSALLNSGVWLAGRHLLATGDSVGFAEFALGLQWFGLAMLAANLMSSVTLPRFTRSAMLDDHVVHRNTARTAIVVSSAGALFIFLAAIIASPLIINFYGDDLGNAKYPLLIYVGAAIVASPIGILSSSLLARDRYAPLVLAQAAWWLLIVVGSRIWSSSVGVITVIGAGYAVQLALLWIAVRTTESK